MDYKEKYEMGLEGIQEILGSGEDSIKMSRLQLRLQGIFPELAESEDERINMKELSIEEKAKAYDKVREKIAIRFGDNVADEIFSQFEMSEDERIRKALVRFHKSSIDIDGIKGEDILAWLEKQGRSNKE